MNNSKITQAQLENLDNLTTKLAEAPVHYTEPEQLGNSRLKGGVEEVMQNFLNCPGYYEEFGVSKAKKQLEKLQKCDKFEIQNDKKLQGKMNLMSKNQFQEYIIEPQLKEINPVQLERTYFYRAANSLHTRIKNSALYITILLLLSLVLILARTYSFMVPDKENLKYGEYIEAVSWTRVGALLIIIAMNSIGILNYLICSKKYIIIETVSVLLFFYSSFFQSYSSDPFKFFVRGIAFVVPQIIIFCSVIYIYRVMSYNALKMLVLIKEVDVSRLLKQQTKVE